jgi:hypothetical protein
VPRIAEVFKLTEEVSRIVLRSVDDKVPVSLALAEETRVLVMGTLKVNVIKVELPDEGRRIVADSVSTPLTDEDDILLEEIKESTEVLLPVADGEVSNPEGLALEEEE